MASSTPELYGDELAREFQYVASWPPQAEVRLGDVGVFQGRGFEVNTTLEKLGMAFEEYTEPARGVWGFASDGAVTIAAEAAGNAAAPAAATVASASATLSFTRANAVFFRAEDVQLQRIEDLDATKQ